MYVHVYSKRELCQNNFKYKIFKAFFTCTSTAIWCRVGYMYTLNIILLNMLNENISMSRKLWSDTSLA